MYFLNTLFVVIAWTLPASYLAFLKANENEFVTRHEKGFSVFLQLISWHLVVMIPVFFWCVFSFSSAEIDAFLQIFINKENHHFPRFNGYLVIFYISAIVSLDTMDDVALYRKYINSGDETTADFNKFTKPIMALWYWFLTFTRFTYDAIFNLIRFRKIVFPTHGVKKEPEIVQAKESKESPPQEEKPRSAKSDATQNILDKLDKF